MCSRLQPPGSEAATPCARDAHAHARRTCTCETHLHMRDAHAHVQVLATSARHAFAATPINQHWRTPYVHVPICGGNRGACGAALSRGQGGAAELPLSPYYGTPGRV